MANIKITDQELQLYTEYDEYSAETDNRPLRRLLENDIAINAEVEAIQSTLQNIANISFYHEIDATNISDKRFALLGTNINALELHAVNGPLQEENIDYEIIIISGVSYISWDGYDLENIVQEGDRFFVKYTGEL